MSEPQFNDLTDVYEALIDWPKRLANEEPFYRRLFSRVGVRRVLDVACGTGHHVAMFHGWGLHAVGADISPRMLERARANAGQSATLEWALRPYDQSVPAAEPFDAAICIGHSLALAPDHETVQRAVASMLGAVRPGGAIVIQVLNLWALADGPCVWQKARRAALPQGDSLIVKGVHRCGSRGYVDLVITTLDDRVGLRSDSVPFLGLEPDELERAARLAGATSVAFFGNYQEQPYERNTSSDLIMVAVRG